MNTRQRAMEDSRISLSSCKASIDSFCHHRMETGEQPSLTEGREGEGGKNRGLPLIQTIISTSYNRHPKDQMSDLKLYPFSCILSGDM